MIFAMCCMFLYTSTRSWHHTHSNDEDLEKHLGMVVMVEVRPRVGKRKMRGQESCSHQAWGTRVGGVIGKSNHMG